MYGAINGPEEQRTAWDTVCVTFGYGVSSSLLSPHLRGKREGERQEALGRVTEILVSPDMAFFFNTQHVTTPYFVV